MLLVDLNAPHEIESVVMPIKKQVCNILQHHLTSISDLRNVIVEIIG